MKIQVLSKQRFDAEMNRMNITDDNVEEFSSSFFISINDTMGTDQIPHFNKDHPNVKVLFFDDVDEDIDVIKSNGEKKTAKAFNAQQAKELFSFINDNCEKDFCIVHCAAGISRSGAVGAFINDFVCGDFLEFKRQNPHVHPNGLVIRLLKRALYTAVN